MRRKSGIMRTLLACVAVLLCASAVGCSAQDEPEQAAEAFLQLHYTVTREQAEDYHAFKQAAPVPAEPGIEAVSGDWLESRYADVSLTQAGRETLFAAVLPQRLLRAAQVFGADWQVVSITLDDRPGVDDERPNYNYEASLHFGGDDYLVKGAIALVWQDGYWALDYIGETVWDPPMPQADAGP